MQFTGHFDADLATQPTKRAAYSDRTAWLMSVMSLFAYLPFEDPFDQTALRRVAEALASKTDATEIMAELSRLIRPGEGEAGREKLRGLLGEFDFELLKTISLSEGLRHDTQCFIARLSREPEAGKPPEDMLVLSFRGTEPTRMADLRTDLDLELMELPHGLSLEAGVAKVHKGFYLAYRSVEDQIAAILTRDDCKGLPLFVTGHSLGGGLAVVATRFVANGSRGACYTFGSPRVSNQAFTNQIFTPVYRIVNAADIVTAVPLNSTVINATRMLIRWLPVVSKLSPYLERVREYRHGGDLRYLGPATPSQTASGQIDFPGMRFLNNPSLIERWWQSGRRLIMSWWRAGLEDHAIETYIAKLAYYARLRQLMRASLNPPQPPAATEMDGDAVSHQ
ncbi:lipase family protein [Maricaulis maris]|uniref:Lipase (Class 3) n=1 Tax=Maricaulis maris TaxID=74318 RepID=A0A495D253_9PROT|nr:lipase family protein [Maricaulis maris]RKQ95617.1 lipase (class 3) [Maricaulis maris]